MTFLLPLCAAILGALLVDGWTLKWSTGRRDVAWQLQMTTPSSDNVNIIRPIGGYEKLMSRKIPDSDSVALSHGAVYLLEGHVDKAALTDAIAMSVEKHPLLRAYIRANLDVPENPLTGPELVWAACEKNSAQLAKEVVSFFQVPPSVTSFEMAWKEELELSLNGPSFPEMGPLWYLKILHASNDDNNDQIAMIFTMNHGLDDQQSLNILMRDILTFYNNLRQRTITTDAGGIESYPFPKSMEEAVCPQSPGLATVDWSIFQLGG